MGAPSALMTVPMPRRSRRSGRSCLSASADDSDPWSRCLGQPAVEGASSPQLVEKKERANHDGSPALAIGWLRRKEWFYGGFPVKERYWPFRWLVADRVVIPSEDGYSDGDGSLPLTTAPVGRYHRLRPMGRGTPIPSVSPQDGGTVGVLSWSRLSYHSVE